VNNKGKLYSWGWNDRGQCGHHPLLHTKEIDFSASAQKSLYANDDCQFGRI